MAQPAIPALSPTKILVLHTATHRGKPKRLSDICLFLGIEDTHLVSYALKKLESRGLVSGAKSGKERIFSVTPKGKEACLRYRELREAVLVGGIKELGLPAETMSSGRCCGCCRATTTRPRSL